MTHDGAGGVICAASVAAAPSFLIVVSATAQRAVEGGLYAS